MLFDAGTNRYTLQSGRAFYANNGILGLAPNPVPYYEGIHEGYDGEAEDEDKPFTAAERQEIAKTMIDAWAKWADEGQ